MAKIACWEKIRLNAKKDLTCGKILGGAEGTEHHIVLPTGALTDGAKFDALGYPVEGVQLLRHSALAEAVLFELVEAYVLVLDHLLHRVVNIVEFLVEFTVEDLRVEAFHHLAVAPFSCVDAYACGEAHSLSGEADFNLNRPVGGLRRSLSAVENKFYFWCCVHT